ncbi:6,7-dimethyl-8-ribityllumazine synthase [Robiginitalea myxolifaciens]|uniref:6,7-dimethyl-8-ribityllumazine synthase n=1 Tax=Robiginitalea myxolifaciens TaxID=400055 RepID=A0A1I6FNC4_9FLAO|nr:6,7-dimethyl-8-ribityllumazine synthase [Robiginitalea myxolifaciens]SFR31432.1 6,7-dimethyl-8-ribityllumazine synthase [Robiginitalea myxolifaciens]
MATAGKDLSAFDATKLPDASGMRIGLVVSQWNTEITEALYQGARDTLIACGVAEDRQIRWEVPGTFELAYGCRRMIEREMPDAVIAIGSVIRGETAHFDFVCSAAAQGIKDLNLRGNAPVIFCVLTDDNMDQAKARSGGKHGNKGTEAAVAAIQMAAL